MAFEREKFNVAQKVALKTSEFTVECNLSAGALVAKVLSLSVGCNVGNAETNNGVLNYSGSVDTKLVFMSEDEQINTVCLSCPFASKFEGDTIENGQEAVIMVKVIDYNIESVGGEMVKASVVIEQSGYLILNSEVSTVSCADSDVCTKKDEITIVKFTGSASKETTVESEINLRENIKKIILTESHSLVKNVEAGSGFVSVSGDVISRVLYLSENDKFECGYINDTFKEEVELDGVTRESFVEGCAFVKQDGVTCEIVQDEKSGKIVVKVPLAISVRAFEEQKVEVISDLYSTKGELNVTTSSFNMTSALAMEVVEGKIEGSLTLDESEPRVDKLLFSGGNSVTITNYYLKDGEIFIEGIAKTSAIYLNDESSSLHSVQLDVPFVISDKYNHDEDCTLKVEAVINDVDVVIKKGREFYYDAKVKACVNCYKEQTCGIISEVAVLDEYPPKNYAMEVIFAPIGRELWEVAKSARVKEEQILLQNPEVTFPVQDNTPLVLFYQRV